MNCRNLTRLSIRLKAGLATLLNGYKLFNGDYQSMAIHWVPINVDGELYYEFTQTVTSVLDPLRTIQTKRWSFSSILGSPISKTCPLASSSTIELSLMDGMDPNTLQLSPTPSKVLTDGRFSFDAKHFQTLEIKADWTDSSVDKSKLVLIHNSIALPILLLYRKPISCSYYRSSLLGGLWPGTWQHQG